MGVTCLLASADASKYVTVAADKTTVKVDTNKTGTAL